LGNDFNQVPDTPPFKGRIDGVDLLRGLAIFFVLMNHVNMRLLIAKVSSRQLGLLWSLSVEEVFYLFFPLVARLFGQGRYS
jgi:peptidoglycan/LPS O-acetylase OafA/YrhL